MDELDESLELSNAEMRLYSRQILLDGWDIEAQENSSWPMSLSWAVEALVV